MARTVARRCLLLLVAAGVRAALVGIHTAGSSHPQLLLRRGRGSRPAMLLDPADLTAAVTTTMMLAYDAADAAKDAAADPEQIAAAASAAADAAADPGWFDLVVVKPFEAGIMGLHGALQSAGVTEAYGPAIILFTVGLKALTFPLTKTQLESTTKMQAIGPAAKALQEKYRDRDPARLNAELQRLYQDNQVNPLAGCLPALAQIPLFIGLYRSLLNLAKADKLTESFLWLPSLEGPVADYTQGISWLKDNWVDGHPPLGWHDTLCYLVLPVLLVISQYASTALLTPKTDDPAQQQSQAILKFLPLMIGWFSLNVPSGLGLYWITNNVVTTLTTLLVRKQVGTPELVGVGGPVSAGAVAAPPKPQGFGRRYGEVIQSTTDSGTKVTIKTPGSVPPPVAAPPVAAPVAAEGEVVSVAAEPVLDGAVPEAAPPAGSGKSAKKKKKVKKGKSKK